MTNSKKRLHTITAYCRDCVAKTYHRDPDDCHCKVCGSENVKVSVR